MADFSPSGIYQLPLTTLDALRGSDSREGAIGDPRVIGWLREAVQEGDRINQADPSYEQAAKGMAYIVGDQYGGGANVGGQPPTTPGYLPKMTINESRKVVQAHASVLTDLKPVWTYKSENPAFSQHGYLLNALIIAWYVNTMADLELANTVKYALAAGTADTLCEWDPHARFGGDHRIHARDYRDTLPWRPAPMSRSVQDWQGVTFREEHSINVLRGMYPTRAMLFQPTSDSLLSTLMGRFRSLTSRLVSPATDTLGGLTNSATANLKPKSGHVLLYRTFLDDYTQNLTRTPIPMGPPGAAWAYVVQPGDRLYPNKRCIVSTPDAIVWDGPSPFWHGMFPFSRLKLWEVPWQFNGVSLLNDLMPVQDSINDLANDLRLGIKQWLDPTTVYDRQAVSETFMKIFDPRRPGAKVKTNPTYGDGFKKLDGPNPDVLRLGLEFFQGMVSKFGDLSGVANLETLLQLRQMPGADTIRSYYEAQTPALRSEGRMIEAYIRDLAEMLKVNTFQYMTKAKRITMLGEAALTLEDFDFDPETLVPAMEPGQPGYTPELDAKLPREQRAQFFHKMLTFRVAPNSLLAMDSAERKMLYLTLAREGLVDILTLLETLEVPNVGTFPPMPLPPVRPPDLTDPATAQAVAAGKYVLGPQGNLLEMRQPLTIIERLQAQSALGLTPAAPGPGRPPSGQAPPHGETKSDPNGGQRQVVSESTHGHGPGGPPGSAT